MSGESASKQKAAPWPLFVFRYSSDELEDAGLLSLFALFLVSLTSLVSLLALASLPSFFLPALSDVNVALDDERLSVLYQPEPLNTMPDV